MVWQCDQPKTHLFPYKGIVTCLNVGYGVNRCSRGEQQESGPLHPDDGFGSVCANMQSALSWYREILKSASYQQSQPPLKDDCHTVMIRFWRGLSKVSHLIFFMRHSSGAVAPV